MMLKVTECSVFPFDSKGGKTLAFAKVVLEKQIVLTGLRIVNGVNGYFVSYPIDASRKSEDYHSVYYPITKELREHIENEVLARYAEVIGVPVTPP
jgi:stage V sporulation protein G